MTIEEIKIALSELINSNRTFIQVLSNTTKNGKNFILKQEIIKYTNFLPKKVSIMQRCWHIMNDRFDMPTCVTCGSITKFRGRESKADTKKYSKEELKVKSNWELCHYSIFCSSKCSMNNEEVKEKYRNSMTKKYGVDNPRKANVCKEKRIKTLLSRYGVDHPLLYNEFKEKAIQKHNKTLGEEGLMWASQRENVKQKTKETFNKKWGGHGISSIIISNKILKTISEKYNIEFKSYGEAMSYQISHPYVQENTINTVLNRYGVKYVSQSPEILNKILSSRYRPKYYEMPSGKLVQCLGYEPKCIQELLSRGYLEDDIVVGNKEIEERIGKIYWIDQDEVEHRYFPDMYIKSTNTVIEVKSSYTYSADFDMNMSKQFATLALGYNFEFVVYDNGRLDNFERFSI